MISSKMGHIVASRLNEIWQIDILYDVSRFETSNKKFKYMFAVIGCLFTIRINHTNEK